MPVELPPLPDPEKVPVLPIWPDAAPYIGCRSKGAAYRAAANGSLPTIKVSEHRLMVPVAALRKLLGLDGAE
jgi:hypothetical protein